MLNVKNLVVRFLRDEEGQTTTEYILILAIAVMLAMKFKRQFVDEQMGQSVNKMNQAIGGALDELDDY